MIKMLSQNVTLSRLAKVSNSILYSAMPVHFDPVSTRYEMLAHTIIPIHCNSIDL